MQYNNKRKKIYERNVIQMKNYEEQAKRELEELLQIIPVKTRNQEFINDLNEKIKNNEYSLALEKINN